MQIENTTKCQPELSAGRNILKKITLSVSVGHVFSSPNNFQKKQACTYISYPKYVLKSCLPTVISD